MAYRYLEPTIAPRGAEIMNIEARKRIIANARLVNYQAPAPNDNQVGERQLVKQERRKPLQPYTSPVSEGLLELVKEEEKRANGGA